MGMHLDNFGIKNIYTALNGCTTHGQREVASNMSSIVLHIINIVQLLLKTTTTNKIYLFSISKILPS
jgi:hypothetical protein